MDTSRSSSSARKNSRKNLEKTCFSDSQCSISPPFKSHKAHKAAIEATPSVLALVPDGPSRDICRYIVVVDPPRCIPSDRRWRVGGCWDNIGCNAHMQSKVAQVCGDTALLIRVARGIVNVGILYIAVTRDSTASGNRQTERGT